MQKYAFDSTRTTATKAHKEAEFAGLERGFLLKKLPKDTVRFEDKADNLLFEFHDTFPTETIDIRIPASDGQRAQAYRVNPDALISYLNYRRAFMDSYSEKEGLAPDIKAPTKHLQSKNFRVAELFANSSYRTQIQRSKLNSSEIGLNDYSIAIALDAMQRWKNPAEKMKCYLAYETINGFKSRIGFVLFQEQQIDGRPVVYIAEAAVSRRGESIGRRLMECVLAHYPAGTEFHILARKFNSDAIVLYAARLGFESLTSDEVAKLDYDPGKYVGYKHITQAPELTAIQGKQSRRERSWNRPN